MSKMPSFHPGDDVTVVLDNGGGTIKAGFAGEADPVQVLPNLVAKAKGVKRRFVGDQVDTCEDVQGLGLTRPIDRGYVVDWDLQREIWNHTFSTVLQVQPRNSNLVVTEPLFNFPSIQKQMDEIVFEDLGFQSFCRVLAPAMGHLHQHSQLASQQHLRNLPGSSTPSGVRPLRGCSLVVDSGFSFTHAVPVWEDSVVLPGVRRVSVGGKVLTGVLKESVSYRSMNMMDDPYIIENVKESLCFCSLDPVRTDLPNSRKGSFLDTLHADYVLPDGVRHKRGFVRDPLAASRALEVQREHLARLAPRGGVPGCTLIPPLGAQDGVTPSVRGVTSAAKLEGGKSEQQVLTLTNERFMVPEALFHPSDIGIPQGGLAEAVVSAMEAIPPPLHPFFYSNVVLVGGSTKFPFFKERLALELRPLVDKDIQITISQPSQPSLSAWKGASTYAASPSFKEFRVTREEYQERGSAACTENFSFQTFQ